MEMGEIYRDIFRPPQTQEGAGPSSTGEPGCPPPYLGPPASSSKGVGTLDEQIPLPLLSPRGGPGMPLPLPHCPHLSQNCSGWLEVGKEEVWGW